MRNATTALLLNHGRRQWAVSDDTVWADAPRYCKVENGREEPIVPNAASCSNGGFGGFIAVENWFVPFTISY